MYEQFRHSLLEKLSSRFSSDDLTYIATCLDEMSLQFAVSRATTALSVPGRAELEQLVKTYLVVKSIEGLAKGTLQNYATHLRQFILATAKAPKDITANDLRLYLHRYQVNRNISGRSLDKIRMCLAGFFKWATTEGYLERDPAVSLRPIKYEVKPRQALTQTELELLRRSCRDIRELAILETLYSTGCRVSELIKIKLTDIDWNAHSVHLIGKGRKHRISYLNAKAAIAIQEYLTRRRHPSEYLFNNDRAGGAMSKENVERVVREISIRTGLANKKVTPHIIRHTTATQALRSGMPVEDIQQLLGHSQISTTMIYAKTSLESVQQNHKKYIV